MVGRVGYAPTTPAMSMQYSTIELTAHKTFYLLIRVDYHPFVGLIAKNISFFI
tara:strand:+ start:2477 stop:2635 length:159 start_codon:yes stop_codon:yes gene_type:complete